MTRREVYRLFGGNRRGDQLEALVGALERSGRVTVTVDHSTGGRPAHRYHWTGKAIDPVLSLLSAS
jgi:hypothetical protein